MPITVVWLVGDGYKCQLLLSLEVGGRYKCQLL